MCSMLKVHASNMARTVLSIARECMGADGILQEHRVIKALMDI